MDAVGLLAGIAGLVTAIGSFAGALVLLRKAREERGKIEAERRRIVAETSSLAKKSDLERAMTLVDQLQGDNERLRSRLTDMEAREERHYREILTLKTGILLLIRQLIRLGVDPEWKPEWAAECVDNERQTEPTRPTAADAAHSQ